MRVAEDMKRIKRVCMCYAKHGGEKIRVHLDGHLVPAVLFADAERGVVVKYATEDGSIVAAPDDSEPIEHEVRGNVLIAAPESWDEPFVACARHHSCLTTIANRKRGADE